MSPVFEEFERRGLRDAFATASRGRRVLLVALTSVSIWLGVVDPAWWRRALMAALVVSMLVLDVHTRRRMLHGGFDPRTVRLDHAVMSLAQLGVIVCTGGLVSPVLPALLPAAFTSGLLFGRAGVVRTVFSLQIPALVALLLVHGLDLMPSLVPVPFRPDGAIPGARLLLSAGIMVSLVSMFGWFGTGLRGQAQRYFDQVHTVQTSALAAHQQRAEDLTTLTGELAHELKNPLASVKGLAQLLARSASASDTKSAERLEVLGREVSRMQGVLEEFLNFSRPVTPLSLAYVDVRRLCDDVALLHEAMATDLGAAVSVDCDPGLAVRLDGRKITQVLVNLLQNALEARAKHVSIEVVRGGGTVEIRVSDDGQGLVSTVGDRAFEPGISTKGDGSGLGLTVSRAIALQHGGTLTLDSRASGGCVARLRFPDHPEEA